MKLHHHCEINACQRYALGGDECTRECDMLVGNWDQEPIDHTGEQDENAVSNSQEAA